jgi:anti-anti-sigma factor
LVLKVVRSPDVVCVEAAGEIDLDSAPSLSALLIGLAEPGVSLVVDVGAVTFFGCAGVDALLAAHHAAGGRLLLVGVGRPVQRLLEMLGLLAIFTGHRDPAAITGPHPGTSVTAVVPRRRSVASARRARRSRRP